MKMSERAEEFKLVKEYIIGGVRRYEFLHTKTKIILNVAASNPEEAYEKCRKMYEFITGVSRS